MQIMLEMRIKNLRQIFRSTRRSLELLWWRLAQMIICLANTSLNPALELRVPTAVPALPLAAGNPTAPTLSPPLKY